VTAVGAGGGLTGVGLGLRRSMLPELETRGDMLPVDFLEIAPENWIDVGDRFGRRFAQLLGRYPFACHGLSLSIGGPAELDRAFVGRLKTFLDDHDIRAYSEHLSYCADDGQLYDLMPIPFTDDAVSGVAERIRDVQDRLGRRVAFENVSYYAAPGQRMSELEFVDAVLDLADCDLLLDVNNVYVNSINHGYDPLAFIRGLPSLRIAYLHVAGHYVEAPDLRVDTHGADVCEPVGSLLEATYRELGPRPTLLALSGPPPVAQLLAGGAAGRAVVLRGLAQPQRRSALHVDQRSDAAPGRADAQRRPAHRERAAGARRRRAAGHRPGHGAGKRPAGARDVARGRSDPRPASDG